MAAYDYAEIKSKFDAEFRRFAIKRSQHETFESFRDFLGEIHHLNKNKTDFRLSYIDPKDNDLLPINNTVNYLRALQTAKPLLRLVVQRHGELEDSYYVGRRLGGANSTSFLSAGGGGASGSHHGKPLISISQPSEFRQVSSIIDVDVVPETCRRVRLLKHGSDKPLGFYIRDGTSVRVTPNGLEKVPGIFISRLLAGGLAESTGLLAVNDEVLEVNGIEVNGKSLDQVTDMMVANSSNLIITVKPANQRTVVPRRGSFSRNSGMSSHHGSMLSRGSSTQSKDSHHGGHHHDPDRDDDVDEIRDLTGFSSASHNNGNISHRNNHHHESINQAAAAGKKPVLHL